MEDVVDEKLRVQNKQNVKLKNNINLLNKMPSLTKAMIKKITENTIPQLNTMTIREIVNILQQAQSTYYNTGTPMFDDKIYDIIKEHLRKKDSKNPILKFVGATIADADKRKETLPVWMGSMDKIKPDPKVLDNFKTKYSGKYLVTDKLDGNSALLQVDNNKKKLFSRGNGQTGQNISHLIPFIKGIPTILPNCVVRGELIIIKKDWDILSTTIQNANARNTVAGIVNAKIPNLEIAKYIRFVAYSIIEPEMPLDAQMKWMAKNKMQNVYGVKIDEKHLTIEWLSNHLKLRRDKSDYEIDGIIVAHNEYHAIQAGKNPTYAFAFKNLVTQDTAEVIVENVEWNVSKDGLIKPTVIFEPVKLGGVTIRRATGFNGEFIEMHKIGPGSVLIIKRSGDVIPHIISSVSPSSSGQPQMPSIPWVWTNGRKDIKTENVSTSEQDLKQLVHFFEKLEVKGLAAGTITKAYKAGYKTVKAILSLDPQVENQSGIRPQLLSDLQQTIKQTPCLTLMHASNTFGTGFGERKLKSILTALESYHLENPTSKSIPTIEELNAIEGISNITSTKFIAGLKKYREFMGTIPQITHCNQKIQIKNIKNDIQPVKTNAFLSDKYIVFTGFRNKDWEKVIQDNGGHIDSSITSRTNLVVAKDTDNVTGKLAKAVAKGIKITSQIEFEKLIKQQPT